MTLSFKQQINGELNYFIERIWSGLPFSLPHEKAALYNHYRQEYRKLIGKDWGNEYAGILWGYPPKLHTIREDKGDRWKAGRIIHPVVNNRTSKRFQFAPEMRCVSTQKIEIKYLVNQAIFVIRVGDRILAWEEIRVLAINDGFKGVHAFLNYFNRDFTGRIIHWTGLKY